MIGATILVAIAYPITGSWQWGGGWLDEMEFYDFAGSLLFMHSVVSLPSPRCGSLELAKANTSMARSNPFWDTACLWQPLGFSAILGMVLDLTEDPF